MLNFDFKKTTRKCFRTERNFEPGEEFVSALLDEHGILVRRDYCLEAWQDPPEDCVGWWKGRIPQLDTGKVYWAPREVLLSYFERVNEMPGQEATAFVMALLLVQKKILRLQDSEDETMLRVFHSKTRSEFDVPIVELSTEQRTTIQNELAQQLFTDQAPDSEPEGTEGDD